MSDPGANGKSAARPSWATYRRLIRYARPYAGRLVIGSLFGILFAGGQTSLLPILKTVIGRVFNPETISQASVLTAAGLVLLFAIARGIGYYLSVYFLDWVGNRVVMDLRQDVYTHLLDSSVLYFTRTRTGDLISRTASDTQLVERAVSDVLGDLVRQPFVFLGAAGVLFWLDARLALVMLVLFPICIVPVALFGRRVRHYGRIAQEKLADLSSIIHESVFGIRIVQAFGMEEYERRRFNQRARQVFSHLMRVTRARAAIEPIIVVISVLGISLVLFYAYKVAMPAETFLTFAVTLVAMYDPVKKLSRIHLTIQRACAAADRVFEILDAEVILRDRPDATEFSEKVESVTFDHVSFGYDQRPVLQDIRLTVRAGERVALVGSSGSGKSTFVSLIPRFFDVTEGRVLLNGRDIRDFTMKSLRRRIGIVTQETILFNDTVANNIAYGSEEASRASIEEAARMAHAEEFILALPQGFETVIGERGVTLSGGQCQRLAIARALARNPPLLILDEATSALDTESERLVQAALDRLMEGRTVFAIAHRLSTIRHADRILVLSDGRIAESGTHDELLARSGHYKHLYELQFVDQD